MGDIITIEAIREMKEKALTGEELPETWKMDIEKYLKMKKKMVNVKKEMYLLCLEKLEEAIEIKELLYGYKNR